VSGNKGNCVVVSSTGQCCYETFVSPMSISSTGTDESSDIAKCTPGGGCRNFTAGCGTACWYFS